MSTNTRPIHGHDTQHPLRWAWWSLILYPVALVLAFLAGEGIPAWLGYADAATTMPPWWVVTLALSAAVIILAAPMVVTVHFSNKAAAQHAPSARIPVILAAVVVGGFILVNLVSGLMILIAG